MKAHIDTQKITEWVNTHEDTPGKYDEIVDFAICTSHPSIPHNQAMIIYTGYNAETGVGEQKSARLYDLQAFIHSTARQ